MNDDSQDDALNRVKPAGPVSEYRRSRLWVAALVGGLGLAIAASAVFRVAAFDARVALVVLVLALAAIGWSLRELVRFWRQARR
jgi:hypothetical protein